MNLSLNVAQILGLAKIAERGIADQEDYLTYGNPHTDYGDEWPEVAQNLAKLWRDGATALQRLGQTGLAERCEQIADCLDASSAEAEPAFYANGDAK